MNHNQPKGYLNEDFRIFHLTDKSMRSYDTHYHDFYKILYFSSGNVSYHIEGMEYELESDCIILVPPGELHRPIIHDQAPYERTIIYLAADFFESPDCKEYNLQHCFTQAIKENSHVIQLQDDTRDAFAEIIAAMNQTLASDEYANKLFQRVKLLEYLILINRYLVTKNAIFQSYSSKNKTIHQILEFINTHITENISIDAIAHSVFLNRSYIMHLFKNEMNCSIGKYITEKRLFLARTLISDGTAITNACYQCGFNNYTTFYQAYRKKYNESPKKCSKK